MMSNNPILRPRFIKRMFFEHFPDDLRPGRLSRLFAHGGTAVAVLFAVLAGTVMTGNLFPRNVSFLPGMRYYAGNTATLPVRARRGTHQFERGRVRVSDMVTRRPRDDALAVFVD
jgi:hypothetical protein